MIVMGVRGKKALWRGTSLHASMEQFTYDERQRHTPAHAHALHYALALTCAQAYTVSSPSFREVKSEEQLTNEMSALLCKDLYANPCREMRVGGLCPP